MRISFFILIILFLSSCCNIYTPVLPNGTKNLSDDYAILGNKIMNSYLLVSSGALKILYYEDYNDQDGQLEYEIKNKKNVISQSNIDVAVSSIKYGRNKLDIPGSSLSPGLYLFITTNEKNVKQYIKFQIPNN